MHIFLKSADGQLLAAWYFFLETLSRFSVQLKTFSLLFLFSECAVKFSKVGCFKDFSRRSNLLFSDRDNIDWIGWNGYIDE